MLRSPADVTFHCFQDGEKLQNNINPRRLKYEVRLFFVVFGLIEVAWETWNHFLNIDRGQ